jgi:hypothetical protein
MASLAGGEQTAGGAGPGAGEATHLGRVRHHDAAAGRAAGTTRERRAAWASCMHSMSEYKAPPADNSDKRRIGINSIHFMCVHVLNGQWTYNSSRTTAPRYALAALKNPRAPPRPGMQMTYNACIS